MHWSFKSAEQENADAQCNIGYSYENGNGLPQDFSQATEWYTKAAD